MLLAVLAITSVPAVADVSERVKTATVKLTAKGEGIDRDGNPTGAQPIASATGVLVSADGLVLTTHHLLDKLGPVFPESVVVTADVGNRNQPQRAWVLDAKPATDLLLLKLRAPGPYPFVELGSAFAAGADAPIHTYGFPGEAAFDFNQSGRITSVTPDGGFLWATTLAFSEGLSGSPVVDDANRLVGIAKGSLPTMGSGMIIPIDLADPILEIVRFGRLEERASEVEALRSRVADLEAALLPLRRELSWSAALDGDVLRLSAKRRFGDDPVGEVLLSVTPLLVTGTTATALPFSLSERLAPVPGAAEGGATAYEWQAASSLAPLRQLASQSGGTLGLELKINPDVTDAFEPVTIEAR